MEKSGVRENRKLIVWAVMIAVLVKAVLLFVVIPYLHEASPTTYQAERFPDWYDLIAMNLAEGNGYRFFPDTTETMLRTPGWVGLSVILCVRHNMMFLRSMYVTQDEYCHGGGDAAADTISPT